MRTRDSTRTARRALAASALAVAMVTGLLASSAGPAAAADRTVTFGNSGTWTVPTGVTSIRVQVEGAHGQKPASTGQTPGGRPGGVVATLAVTPGEVLQINVFVGGGQVWGGNNRWAGEGGGATDIRRSPYALANRLVVAGGGGGGGGMGNDGREGQGGAGGDAGQNGQPGPAAQGGFGASGSGPGRAGAGGPSKPDEDPHLCDGYDGTFGTGGLGGDPRGVPYAGYSGGGGGGGGWYGGGGGGGGCTGVEYNFSWPPGAGGGGGSSHGPAGSTFYTKTAPSPSGFPVAITYATQSAPSFTSANTTTFTAGAAGRFTVTANGDPVPTLTRTGTLPTGVTFNTSTGVLSGTPAVGSGGSYPITFRARNGISPDATQNFTLTVNEGSAFTSADATTFVAGQSNQFTVAARGFPKPTLSRTGPPLPAGVTFDAATGRLSGTPADGTGGRYPMSFRAANGVSADATQGFLLTVNEAPEITSGASATFPVGSDSSFTVSATGYPAPRFSVTGQLPGGVTFTPATGVLSGRPISGTAGTYALTFRAANGVSPDDTQGFTLTVTGGGGGGPPKLAIGDVRVAEGREGATQATFTVTRTGTSTGQSAVGYRTVDGTAFAPTDFQAASSSLTFSAGQTSKTIIVAVNGDGVVEPDETFTVVLSGPIGATITDDTGAGAIVNDDIDSLASIGDASVVEGDTGTTTMTFPITLSKRATQPVTVTYSSARYNATPGVDYTEKAASVTFAPGETSKSATITVRGDTLDEANEAFVVNLVRGYSSVDFGDGGAVGTIVDDDGDPVASIGDGSVVEGDTGTTTMTFPITLSGPATRSLTVTYASSRYNATPGVDYTEKAASVTFAPGETSKSATIAVRGDSLDEGDEAFVVNLVRGYSSVDFGDGGAVGIILDDD